MFFHKHTLFFHIFEMVIDTEGNRDLGYLVTKGREGFCCEYFAREMGYDVSIVFRNMRVKGN